MAVLELLGITRVKYPSNLAIGNLSTTLSFAQIRKIGTSTTNREIKKFRQRLNDLATSSQM